MLYKLLILTHDLCSGTTRLAETTHLQDKLTKRSRHHATGPLQKGLLQEGHHATGLLQKGPLQEGPLQKGPLQEGPLQEGLLQEGPLQEGLQSQGA